MKDIGILASTDPVALEQIGLGTWNYTLVSIDGRQTANLYNGINKFIKKMFSMLNNFCIFAL